MFVHAGPFANIAIGQSSVIADRIGLKLNEYHVTESGFGADIGYEKFWNLKCHYSGLTPDAAVVVATVRALKSHGGAPVPVPGRPLPEEYRTENVGFVEAGCCNLLHHIKTVKRSGVSPVVCINAFVTDTKAEIAKVRELCEAAGGARGPVHALGTRRRRRAGTGGCRHGRLQRQDRVQAAVLVGYAV